MDKFLESFPRPVLALFAIAIGIFLIFITNKPHSVCDSQIEILQESQKGAIFQGKGKRAAIEPRLSRQVDTCKLGNSPGACFEMFSTYRKLMVDLGNVPNECRTPTFEVAEVRKALLEGVELMVQLAWGDAPEEYSEIDLGWFESADQALFCKMRNFIESAMGPEEYSALLRKTVGKLPGEKRSIQSGVGDAISGGAPRSAIEILGWEESINRSIFQLRCSDAF